jgi:hypothetical protein
MKLADKTLQEISDKLSILIEKVDKLKTTEPPVNVPFQRTEETCFDREVYEVTYYPTKNTSITNNSYEN